MGEEMPSSSLADTADTQKADELLSLSMQELKVSQETPAKVWARLYPENQEISQYYGLMGSKEYIFGRTYLKNEVHSIVSKAIMKTSNKHIYPKLSKVHFKISKEEVPDNDSDEPIIIAYIQDFSYNGTFVSGIKLEKGQKVILSDNDTISVCYPNTVVFTFFSAESFQSNSLPVELRSKYQLSRTLGQGAFGVVKLLFCKTTYVKYALKTINLVQKGTDKVGVTNVSCLLNEINIIKGLRHPFIVEMISIHTAPTSVFLVLELMGGGELMDRLKSVNGLPEKQAKFIMYQIAHAVKYLHSCKITHRDLKPENVLLKSNDDFPRVKVSDFNLSKLVHSDKSQMKTFCGTPMYTAPEVLAHRGTYTSQVDIWSLGVLLYTTLTSQFPFQVEDSTDDSALFEEISRGNYVVPEQLENLPEARDLISNTIKTNPRDRITINEVLCHPWFWDIDIRQQIHAWLQECHQENNNSDNENVHPTQGHRAKKLRAD